jgi:hypothetical protein
VSTTTTTGVGTRAAPQASPTTPAPTEVTPVAAARAETVASDEHAGAGGRGATAVLVAIVLVGIGLRVWRAGFGGLSFDESFTALTGRLPLGDLFAHLRGADTHPPLDYLLRAPIARAAGAAFALRVPSLVFSAAALIVFAVWSRGRGRSGLLATTLIAISEFQVLHGGEARMYALLQLVGVLALVLADGWVRTPRRWHATALAALLVVACFDHVSALLLAGGLLVLPGLRRDADAWRWRAAVALATVVWAAVWGPSFLDQASHDWAAWIPPTSPDGIARAIGGQLTGVAGLRTLLAVAVVAGGVALWRRDNRLGWIWVCLGALPFVAAAVIGAFSPFLLDRTLSVAAWAPALALGVIGDVVIARWRLVGTAVVAATLAAILIGTAGFLAVKQYDVDLSMDHLAAVVRSGDVVATRPARYGALADYRIGVLSGAPMHAVRVPGVSDTDAFRFGAAPATGRVWLLALASDRRHPPGYESCAPLWTDGVTRIECLLPTGR